MKIGDGNYWEIIEEPTGFSVEKNGRLVRYDCVSIEEAVSLAKKRGAIEVALREMPKSKSDKEPERNRIGLASRPQFQRRRIR